MGKSIVVFGANGRVGRLVVDELTARGYSVRAFVHGKPERSVEGVDYVQGDVYEARDIDAVLNSADAVISCLGSWGTKNKDILTSGMTHIIPAMERSKISRIISLTGADAWTEAEKPSAVQKIMHGIFGLFAGKILRDGEQHMRLLAGSELTWTVLRSPVMNDRGSKSCKCTLDYPMPWTTINRRAVAQAVCDQLESNKYLRQSPFLHRV